MESVVQVLWLPEATSPPWLQSPHPERGDDTKNIPIQWFYPKGIDSKGKIPTSFMSGVSHRVCIYNSRNLEAA